MVDVWSYMPMNSLPEFECSVLNRYRVALMAGKGAGELGYGTGNVPTTFVRSAVGLFLGIGAVVLCGDTRAG